MECGAINLQQMSVAFDVLSFPYTLIKNHTVHYGSEIRARQNVLAMYCVCKEENPRGNAVTGK